MELFRGFGPCAHADLSGGHLTLQFNLSPHLATMSSSSGSNTLTKSNRYRHFQTQAEFDAWIAERGKKNLAGLKAVGGSIIDFNVRCLHCLYSFALL
jgi:hypothetical protein